MWASEEISSLVEWLRRRNDTLPEEKKVGFYGLDVYSLWDSLEEVIEYLERVDPDALPAAPTGASSPTARTRRSTRGRRPSCRPPARTRL